MTKILELPEELQRDLHRAAARDQISDEDLAFRVLREYLEREASAISDEKWAEVSKSVIDDNRELLKRLAK